MTNQEKDFVLGQPVIGRARMRHDYLLVVILGLMTVAGVSIAFFYLPEGEQAPMGGATFQEALTIIITPIMIVGYPWAIYRLFFDWLTTALIWSENGFMICYRGKKITIHWHEVCRIRMFPRRGFLLDYGYGRPVLIPPHLKELSNFCEFAYLKLSRENEVPGVSLLKEHRYYYRRYFRANL